MKNGVLALKLARLIMQPHHQFFTSLKQLEKRLRLENHPSPPSTVSPPPPPTTEPIDTTQVSDSLGTPIYLNSIHTNKTPSSLQESEAPIEFLPTPSEPPHGDQPGLNKAVDQDKKTSLDRDIELLMQLLRLSELDEGDVINDVGCDDVFYGKIVGVKGPKSVKEVERLEGWIRYFLKGEKKEPYGLAHLLLGKAGSVHSSGDGFGGFAFPSTIDEFLLNDPPVD